MSSTQMAREVIARLVSTGLRHIVIAPGSRSAPLAYAAADAEAAGLVRVHVRVDERFNKCFRICKYFSVHEHFNECK